MPDPIFYTASFLISFLGLVLALWIGVYLVVRSPRSLAIWLATLTLWSLAGFFLDSLLLFNGAERQAQILGLGWIVLPAIPAAFHLTVRLLSESQVLARRPMVIALYGVAVMLIALDAAFSWILTGSAGHGQPASLTNALKIGPAFPLFVLFLVAGLGLCLNNLWLAYKTSMRQAARTYLRLLLVSAALALVASIYGGITVGLSLQMPILPIHLILLVVTLLFGTGIMLYSSFTDGRAMRIDFTYASLVAGILTVGNLVMAWFSHRLFNVPLVAYVFLVAFGIVTYTVFPDIGLVLDRLVHQKQSRQLRANLRALAREVGTGTSLRSRLRMVLASLCQALNLSQGFIALRAYTDFKIEAVYRTGWTGTVIPEQALATATNETVRLPLEANLSCLTDMVLLLPIMYDGGQIGAIVLGPKADGGTYFTDDELEYLVEAAERLADVIHKSRVQADAAERINTLVAEFRIQEQTLQHQVQEMLRPCKFTQPLTVGGMMEDEFVDVVEDGLCHLYDFAYLGEHSLSRLAAVERLIMIQGGYVTPLDRGAAVKEILVDAVETIRPEGAVPSKSVATPPPSEWHPYSIMHELYIEGATKQEVMATLYVSEATFDRLHRSALHRVAKALGEIDRVSFTVPVELPV